MPDSLWNWLFLLAAAFAAGAVNAAAGGGTLLIFPSLLAFLPPVAANATSTFALLPGALASGLGYRHELAQSKAHLVRLLPPSVAGGLIGSLLVTWLPERIFASAVPWLLVVASVLLLLQRPIARYLQNPQQESPSPRTVAGIVFFQFLVGIYGGYFGAGIGILMLSSLAFLGIPGIHQRNAVKSILAAAMNGATVAIFLLSGVIVWKYALAMAVAGMGGGYAGARVARRIPPEYLRIFVVCIGFGVALYSWFGKK